MGVVIPGTRNRGREERGIRGLRSAIIDEMEI